MSKKQTAMQSVIKKMKDARDGFPAIGFDEEFVRGFDKAFQMAVFIAQQVGLPEERTAIEEAYSAPFIPREKFKELAKKQAKKYFESTYLTEDKTEQPLSNK